MNLHLAEIATQVAPGAIAALLLDQAGWHISNKLVVPANIVIVHLPPKCPELNPTENIWQLMRDNCLSNRVFKSYTDRHEWLDQYIIETIEEAQHHATQWLWTYNNERPNMGIGGITPAQKLKMAA